VTSWEMCDANLDDQYRRDFILKQPSMVGPWVALGLGVTLAAFLSYLVYVNVLISLPAAGSPEPLLRLEVASTARVSRAKRTAQRPLGKRQPTATLVPQGRAANALLGGQGPALPLEHAVSPLLSASPPVSLQTAAGRR
jgi:hypothetical protein